MVKILYVIGTMQVGGAERHLFRVVNALVGSGYQIALFTLDPNGPMLERYKALGVPVYGLTIPKWLQKREKMRRLLILTSLMVSSVYLFGILWVYRPKIIHFFLPATYILGGFVSLFTPKAFRIMSRRSLNNYQKRRWYFAKLERFLHPKMDFVSGNSSRVIEQLKQEGIPDYKLKLIYNGLDTSDFAIAVDRKALRTELQLSEQDLIGIMVANLIPYKGHLDLIDAFYTIKDRLPRKVVFLLVGRDDGILSALNAKIETLGLSDSFRFLGERKDVPQLLAMSDIGILCSHEEGFSNAILEGMAAGLPMVVTDVGGNAEAVVNEQTGFIVPAKQPILLAQALLDMMTLTNKEELGYNGRKRVEKEFSMDRCIAGYKSLYNECIQEKT